MYEICDGSNEIETRPRHVCPFAIVAFSYGKMITTPELEKKRFSSFYTLSILSEILSFTCENGDF